MYGHEIISERWQLAAAGSARAAQRHHRQVPGDDPYLALLRGEMERRWGWVVRERLRREAREGHLRAAPQPARPASLGSWLRRLAWRMRGPAPSSGAS